MYGQWRFWKKNHKSSKCQFAERASVFKACSLCTNTTFSLNQISPITAKLGFYDDRSHSVYDALLTRTTDTASAILHPALQ